MKALSERRGKLTGLRGIGVEGNLLLLAGFLAVGLVSPSLWLKGAVLCIVLLLLSRSGGPKQQAVQGPIGLKFVFVFAFILFIAQALSVREGSLLFHVGVPITSGGLRAGGAMALRFLLILTSSFLFVTVTDPDRLAHSLIRWGIPYRFGYAFVLSLRFVPFFRNELRIVREAQQIRGIRTSVRSLSRIRRAVRFTFIPVLVSGLMRVDSIAMSMKGRAFGLHRTRTSPRFVKLGAADLLAAVSFGVLVALVALSRKGSWP